MIIAVLLEPPVPQPFTKASAETVTLGTEHTMELNGWKASRVSYKHLSVLLVLTAAAP